MSHFDPSCIDVADFLEKLDMRNVSKATESEFKFSCPYPTHATGDESPSAYMNMNTTNFFCHSCHAKGNAITFTSEVLRVSPLEAIRMLKQRYSPSGINPDSRSMVEEVRKIIEKKESERRVNVPLDESALEPYSVDWEVAQHQHDCGWARYMFERGFSLFSLITWQFGYSRTHERITLPVRDHEGKLVGIKARSWNGRKPKYLNKVDDINPFLKNEVVFGLDRVIRSNLRDLILVEGEWNVVAMHQHNYLQTVGINGSYFGKTQISLLKRYADSVTLFFDSDAAGHDATHALSEELGHFIPVFICPEHSGDPADMHTHSVDAIISDRVSLTTARLLLTRS